ncbi:MULTISPECIES: hypothetical protein [Streptomyces]|uniref:DUF2059 domain-containing protein n=2 Tax=Streptomyces TaxID=1883 RepID=A0ABV9IPL6_9ACTN
MSIILGLAALTLGHCLPTHQTPAHTPPTAKPTVRQFIDQAPDETRITYEAVAVYLAGKVYDEAVKQDDPAKTLDGIADALPDTMTNVFQTMGTDPEFREVLRPAVADQIWAYTAVEYARVEAGDGYGYLFDFLVEKLRAGADPHTVRATALDVPKRLRELAEAAEQTGGDQ